MARREVLAAQGDNVLADAAIPELPNHYRGKVRDNYDLADGRRIIVATDRLSAFDRVLTAIPCKGQVLTQIARFWFDATSAICPNHVIEYPDPNVVVCRQLDILPVEIVVRDYLTGTTGTSIWPMYKSGRREIYGIRFPDGLRENQKLPQTVITPTTKAVEGEHDEPITAEQITSRGLLTREQWDSVSELALDLFACGRAIAAERGLILVDTKYEFGRNQNGQIILADEIHTPDSSRYWIRDSHDQRFAAGAPPRAGTGCACHRPRSRRAATGARSGRVHGSRRCRRRSACWREPRRRAAAAGTGTGARRGRSGRSLAGPRHSANGGRKGSCAVPTPAAEPSTGASRERR